MANFSNPSFETDTHGWIAGKLPSDLPDLHYWFNAEQESYSNGAPVNVFHDQSGNGNDLIQPNGIQQPLFASSDMNGLPSISFGNTAFTTMYNTTELGSANGSWSVLIASHTPAGGPGTLFAYGLGGPTGQALLSRFGVWYLNQVGNPSGVSDGAYSSNPEIGFATHEITTDIVNLGIDGIAPSSGTQHCGNFGGLVMGDYTTAGNAQQYTGLVAEFILYYHNLNPVLAAADLDALHSYLAIRYAVPVGTTYGATSLRDTSQFHVGTASLKVATNSYETPVFQTFIPGTGLKTLTFYVYNGGLRVKENVVLPWYDGAPINSAAYYDVGGGWFKVVTQLTGSASAKKVGAYVQANQTVWLDGFDLSDATDTMLILQPTTDAGDYDNLLYSALADTNFGSYASWEIGHSGTDLEFEIARFDLSAIPGGMTIVSADLQFQAQTVQGDGDTITVRRILAANAGWDANLATYNNKDGTGPTPWAGQPGANLIGTDLSTTKFGETAAGSYIQDEWVTWTLNLSEFALLQAANNGIWIGTESADVGSNRLLGSGMDDGSAFNRPKLVIHYSAAAPTNISKAGNVSHGAIGTIGNVILSAISKIAGVS